MKDKVYKVTFYSDQKLKNEPFRVWFEAIRDYGAQARIAVRIQRLEEGNFGDHRSVGRGVFELRMSFGSGYRIYYGFKDFNIVLLLLGGDKSTQAQDTKKAHNFWLSHKRDEDGKRN